MALDNILVMIGMTYSVQVPAIVELDKYIRVRYGCA